MTVSGVTLKGANASEFELSANTCGSSINGHSFCKVSVTFAPMTAGSKSATLTISDSANNSPQSVSLTGTGIVPASITPSSLTFAAQKIGTTSTPKKITVKNNLKATLSISSIILAGANAGDFVQSATTCEQLWLQIQVAR